ncbi:Uncharacterised protein [Amycolatopsis camponoti]|uniref:Uncharacterized protein n=1 Tax=Amycolatopsis camponoti TaxID=2606593 RepID=A0A6I8LUC2_9PSEU|nr:Uncharacterised protein [Amycolatopsis camponoti]
MEIDSRPRSSDATQLCARPEQPGERDGSADSPSCAAGFRLAAGRELRGRSPTTA